MKSKRKIFIAAIIAVICIGVYLLFRGNGIGSNHSKESEFAIEFKDSELKEERNGELVWKLRAGNVNIDKDKNILNIKDAECVFNDKGISLDIRADTATFNKKDNILYLEGSIEGHSSDGTKVSAKKLIYDGKTEILSSDQQFFVEKDGKQLTADSFTADRVLNIVKAKGNARLTDRG